MKVLETERLVVRRLTADDAEFMFGLLNEPSFIRFIGDRGIKTLDDARGYILNGPMASYERFGFGLYLVTLKAGGTPIGMCGLLKRDSLEDADVGFAFRPAFWLQGYAFESAAAVIAHGKADLGLKRIVAVVMPENRGSIRVLEKLGMSFERMARISADGPELQLFGLDV
jgi:ribosomal-protein-alanine N-acetyltransferase